MILASAGSGKTWQLTNRYIALMGLQLKSGLPVSPERIIAVTFTRKAAGEFFDSILVKLAKAAASPKDAAALASDPRDPLSATLATLTPQDFEALLRVFISRMPRLFLGTLDSFFSNILRAFPAEFGLTSDFEVMDEYQTAVAQARVYQAVFERQLGASKREDPAQQAFLEAFRLATFGKAEVRITRQLDEFIEDLHDLYLSAPGEDLWGNAAAIWEDGGKDWFVPDVDFGEEFTRLFRALEGLEKVDWKYWEEFREQLPLHHPGTPIKGRVEYMMDKLLPGWTGICGGAFTVKLNRTVHELDRACCDPIRRLIQRFVGAELAIKLRRTRGIWELLSLYESTYADQVRRQGLLTFQDLQLLLSGHDYGQRGSSPILTQIPGDDDRLQIDYRLDARYDHWLLDEFQDTNILQWRVISNLIDEVVQDNSGTRSLFQVGDIKQAIYAWRGGDTRLFTDIAKQYNARETRVHPRNLDVSWRSGIDVIDTVNRVFGCPATLAALELPAPTIAQWQWHDHEVASTREKIEGCTMLLSPVPPAGEKSAKEDSYALVVGILEEINPVERGIRCAILVQSNKQGTALIDYIRAHCRIPVVSESDILIASDNPLNRALMSVFQCAAHPGDTFAWEHLRMTPYGAVIARDSLKVESFSRRVLGTLFEGNFETVTRKFIALFEAELGLPLDPFTRSRAEEFALAARLFDEKGSRDIDDFLAYISRHKTREPIAGSAVQVMTVHKSKGLTFDAVILPELGGNSLTTARRGIGAKEDENREAKWVFDLPVKEIVKADPVLGAYAAEGEAAAAYESLCKFYVAMTRASHANYLIADPLSEKSTVKNFIKLLELSLEEEPVETDFHGVSASIRYQSRTPRSNRRWYEHFAPAAPSPAAPAEDSIRVDPARARLRPRRRTPSGSEIVSVSAAQIFSPRGGEAREFGTLVHAIFEDIEWADEGSLLDLRMKWEGSNSGSPAVLRDALEQVTGSLEKAEILTALSKPSEDALVWREKSFEILLKGEWLSGTFDRVQIERDTAGNPTRATILDFKTDRVATAEEIAEAASKYRPQLETYREVLQRMTGLPATAILCRLIFTRSRVMKTL
jgi:ATP-dependent helicase/nuclease subunit A